MAEVKVQITDESRCHTSCVSRRIINYYARLVFIYIWITRVIIEAEAAKSANPNQNLP